MTTFKDLVKTISVVPTSFPNIQYRGIAWFCNVSKAPPDPIFGVNDAYTKDKSKEKVNLSVGAYRTDDGKPAVLKSVRIAEDKIRAKEMNKEYAGMLGSTNFSKLSFDFAMGENNDFAEEGRAVYLQTLSGTGALNIAANFFNKFFPKEKIIYVSQPTWANHYSIFKSAGLSVKTYRYYDPKKIALDFEGMIEDLKKIPDDSIILFHSAAHNPTGFDPTTEQWHEISDLCKKKRFYILFDNAYQGFASGDPVSDVCSLRILAQKGINIAVCQSFSKNMGLYGERIGCLSFIADSPDEAAAMASQLKLIVRAIYSNPPINGARIVEEILSDQELKTLWLQEVKQMAARMQEARKSLRDGIIRAGSKRCWDHITEQIGMFSYTGLTKEAVAKLKADFHVYLLDNGRISIAGINTNNVEHVAEGFHKVTSS